MKPTYLLAPALLCALFLSPGTAPASPTSTGGNLRLLPDDSGAGGGRVSGGNIVAEISVGDALEGGVSEVTAAGVQTTGGYTGQLYDPVEMQLSADPGTTVNEGESVQLLAVVTLDDGTALRNPNTWSVLGGPLDSIEVGGLARVGTTPAPAVATVGAVFAQLTRQIDLTVAPLPYAPSPLDWEGNGEAPYTVFLGTAIDDLFQVGTSSSTRYNPGPLQMGTTYYWQVFDDGGGDVTPGGPGPATFTTSLYRPDNRIGRSAATGAHLGNGIVNLNGAGQTIALRLKTNRPSQFYFSVENDGDVEDRHRLQGSRKHRDLQYLNYFRLTPARSNATAAVISGRYSAGAVDPGEIVNYQAKVRSRGKKRVAQKVRVTSTSENDIRGADGVASRISATAKKKKKKKRK